ncbi:enolase C-terminal domain-like protein [Streptomyces sp900116325]|uniref:enolase C-terminal domain-like protein n=1 Tax=Streptomyces sp. 900116325 TaxID=3154295 RepID=UPI0033BC44A6
MTAGLRIHAVKITPVAFRDPALLNAVGVHEPYALRAIVEVDTGEGLGGLGETYADEGHLRRLRAAADARTGMDVYALGAMHRRVAEVLSSDNGVGGTGLTGMITTSSAVDRVFSPFEVACLDLQGKAAGRPVSDLLGGAVRESVPFSAYLFYKWAAHPGQEPDDWGAALDPEAIVAQAHRMLSEYGFTAIKLKGGVRPPAEEVEAVLALREAFPDVPLRLDPNAAWSVGTSVEVARRLEGVLEYLEDPTPELDGMAQVARQTPIPLATNMCVVAFDHLAPAVEQGSVQVVLSDHHYWGGLHRSKLLSNAVSAVVTRDIIPAVVRRAKELPPATGLLVARVCTVVFITVSMLVAIEADHFGGVLGIIVGLVAAVMGPISVPMLLGLLPIFRKCGPRAALSSWALGLLGYVLVKFVLESTDQTVIIVTPLVTSLVVYVVVGLLSPEPDATADAIVAAVSPVPDGDSEPAAAAVPQAAVSGASD